MAIIDLQQISPEDLVQVEKSSILPISPVALSSLTSYFFSLSLKSPNYLLSQGIKVMQVAPPPKMVAFGGGLNSNQAYKHLGSGM